MPLLDDLIKIDGVESAGRFTVDGKCSECKSHKDMSQEMKDKTAQYIATVTMMFNTLADAFSKESQMAWTPQQSWTYSGGDWSVVVRGNVVVFCQTEKTDMGKLFQVLESGKAEEVRAGI